MHMFVIYNLLCKLITLLLVLFFVPAENDRNKPLYTCFRHLDTYPHFNIYFMQKIY